MIVISWQPQAGIHATTHPMLYKSKNIDQIDAIIDKPKSDL